MRCKNKIIAYAALCLMLLSWLLPVPVEAKESVDTTRECTLQIQFSYTGTPLTNTQFHVYQAGTINAEGEVSLTGDFATFPVSSELLTASGMHEAAELLYSYVLLNQLQPDTVMTIDASGTATATLPVGLYLVVGQRLDKTGGVFRTAPMLVSMPYRFYEDEPWGYQVLLSVSLLFYIGLEIYFAKRKKSLNN